MPASADAHDTPQAGIDPRQFRQALGAFATGVAVVTTQDAAGAPVGLTVNSFTSVSLNPPLVLFCLGKQSASLTAFRDSGAFAVHVMPHAQQDLTRRFASRVEDRFDGVAWHPGHGGAPVIEGVLACFECALHACVDAGDHLILIGQVQRFSHQPSDAPLLYFQGGFHSLPRTAVAA